jgi:hypothetical protein
LITLLSILQATGGGLILIPRSFICQDVKHAIAVVINMFCLSDFLTEENAMPKGLKLLQTL